MDLHERIARRRAAKREDGIIVDRDAISPTVHRAEPTGRGSVLEQVLDAVEPTFDGSLPDPFAVVGPPGSGTSAVITALFESLTTTFGDTRDSIGTTTRAGSGTPTTWFVYVDARGVSSAFAFYRTLLSTVTANDVPTSGVGTDDLRERLVDQLSHHQHSAVIAIDHHDEPETLGAKRATELLEAVGDHTTVIPVGQSTPAGWSDRTIEVPAYRRHELVDILTQRASNGLAAGALEHRTIREVADWAGGNAHDALTAVFTGATLAGRAGHDRITAAHLERAKADVPEASIHLDRPLSLPETRQRVLLSLLDLEFDGPEAGEKRPIRELSTAVADRSTLTDGTVKRFLYEMADKGVLARVPIETAGSGRRPSTIEPRFPTIAFRSLTTVNG